MSHTYHQWLSGEDITVFYEDCAFQMDQIITFATEALSSLDASFTTGALQNLISFYSVATGECPSLNPQYLGYVIAAFKQVDIQLQLEECLALETMYDSQIPS